MKATFTAILFFISYFVFAQDTIYINSKGNNKNSGFSPLNPWKTIPYLQLGKVYLLNKSDTFYFNINSINNPDPSQKIVISSYGSGAKPVISLYKRINEKSWVQHKKNIWKVNLTNSSNYTGFLPLETNIGFLKVDGKIYGRKYSNISQLNSDWSFYSDDTYLYVFLNSNPSLNSLSIEVSCNYYGISASDNMEISNIKIIGAGGHGISVSNKTNVSLKNIDINEIGGSYLPGYGNGTTRYGNGIEFWNGSQNCLVEECSVSNVYDVAYTMQGSANNTHFKNIIFNKNNASNNEQSFETWVSGWAPGFSGCKFINNECYNAGFGWSHNVRPDTNVAVHLLSYAWEVKNADLLIEGNSFSRAKSGLYYWGVWDPTPPYTSRKNIITLDSGTNIRSQISTYKINNPSGFVFATNKEIGSTFSITNFQTLSKSFIHFIAIREIDNVKLNWQTVQKGDFAYFEVERSIGSSNNYTKLGTIPSEIDEIVDNTYSLIDFNSTHLTSYYRLRMIDFNNQVSYSNILSVKGKNSAKDEVQIFPNPAINRINIDLLVQKNCSLKIEVFCLSGKNVKQQVITLVKGSNNIGFDVKDLPAGMYTVRLIQSEGNIQVYKFIKS